jgi:hypothetical protein
MNAVGRLERIASNLITLLDEIDEAELKPRNARQVRRAADTILEAVAKQRADVFEERQAELAEEQNRRLMAIQEVEQFATERGLEVKVVKSKRGDGTYIRNGVLDLRVPGKEIRQWAQESGLDIKPRGIIPEHIRHAYALAHAG